MALDSELHGSPDFEATRVCRSRAQRSEVNSIGRSSRTSDRDERQSETGWRRLTPLNVNVLGFAAVRWGRLV